MLRHGSRHSASVALNGAPIGLAFSGISYLLTRWQFRAWLERTGVEISDVTGGRLQTLEPGGARRIWNDYSLFSAPQPRGDPSFVSVSRLRGQHASLLGNQRNDVPAIDPPGCQEPVRPAVTGRWDLTIVTNAGRRAPSWLEVHWSGNRVLVGQFVGVVGSVRPISRLDFANDTLRFSVPPQWEEGNGAFQFTGAFASDTLAGSVITPDGDRLAWSAHRAPSLERRGPVQGGRVVRLFNGT